MTFIIRTHDAWGVVPVGSFESLEEARQAFSSLCQDPWYRQDGSMKALELARQLPGGSPERLEWLPLR
ncbi:MAG: hypothetical protein ACKO50_11340 [Cyanobium sp.]